MGVRFVAFKYCQQKANFSQRANVLDKAFNVFWHLPEGNTKYPHGCTTDQGMVWLDDDASHSRFATDATSQLDVLRHDGHTLGVDGAEVGVLEQMNEVVL